MKTKKKNAEPPAELTGSDQTATHYHHGPPAVGQSWSNERESRAVLAVIPGRASNAYFVRYRCLRGWPRKTVGINICSGDQWSHWLRRHGAKLDTGDLADPRRSLEHGQRNQDGRPGVR